MFEIGWSEILMIAVVAIVVIGPKDLPRTMRFVGQWAGKMKRMGREFQNQFKEALREAELDDVRKDIADIMSTDPLADVKKEMSKVQTGINADLAKADPAKASEPPVPLMTATAEPAAAAPALVEPDVSVAPATSVAVSEPEPATVSKAAS
jgi:sec-independent protein translocase protein TatB